VEVGKFDLFFSFTLQSHRTYHIFYKKKLANLLYLNLANDQIVGHIPKEIESSLNLEFIFLSLNCLFGSIPWKLENWSTWNIYGLMTIVFSIWLSLFYLSDNFCCIILITFFEQAKSIILITMLKRPCILLIMFKHNSNLIKLCLCCWLIWFWFSELI
jgi:hypothetical protein